MEKQILDIIKKLDELHINDDYAFDKYWKQLTFILSENEFKTIEYLSGCSDSDIISHLSSVFEDVAHNLQSKRYIKCLESLGEKYPYLIHRIDAAKSYTINWSDEQDSIHNIN